MMQRDLKYQKKHTGQNLPSCQQGQVKDDRSSKQLNSEP